MEDPSNGFITPNYVVLETGERVYSCLKEGIQIFDLERLTWTCRSVDMLGGEAGHHRAV